MNYNGIAIPLAALRTEKSLGIGTYLELIPLLRLCNKIHFNLIQLLPIQDTHLDPSPYNALSSLAYHPIYLTLDENTILPDELVKLIELNEAKHVDYETLLNIKMKILKRCYESEFNHLESQLEDFLKKNPDLKAYSAFKFLKNQYQHLPFISWKISQPPHQLIEDTFVKNRKECFFYIYLQFLIYSQLKSVKDEADLLNIALMCDIPILISSDSLEVFLNPEYFDLSHVVGTPPDDFSKEGQYWGLPPYNWDHLAESGYELWKKKLQMLEKVFSIFRIDHILGFFRFFIIPKGCLPSSGHYVPKQESAALMKGKTRLEKICTYTSMQPIGEDLGTKPKGLEEVLHLLKIAQTKIIRWEKTDHHFIPFSKYPHRSAVSLSTHDIPLFSQWWHEHPTEQHAFCELFHLKWQKDFDHNFFYEVLQKFHRIDCLYKINLIQEYLSLNFQYISKNPADDRINIPGTVNKTNWVYRMKPTVEKLNLDHQWIEKMQTLGRLS